VFDDFAYGCIPGDLVETLIIPIPKIDEPQSLVPKNIKKDFSNKVVPIFVA
jgi:hypothetical protein